MRHIFSSEIADEIQLVLKYFSQTFQVVGNDFFVHLKASIIRVKLKSLQFKEKFEKNLSNVTIHFDVMWSVAIDTIYKFEGLLDFLSSRYKDIVLNIKSQSQKARNKIIMILKSEIKEIVDKAVESVEKYEIFRQLQQFYLDVRNYLKSFDIKQKLQSSLEILKR